MCLDKRTGKFNKGKPMKRKKKRHTDALKHTHILSACWIPAYAFVTSPADLFDDRPAAVLVDIAAGKVIKSNEIKLTLKKTYFSLAEFYVAAALTSISNVEVFINTVIFGVEIYSSIKRIWFNRIS